MFREGSTFYAVKRRNLGVCGTKGHGKIASLEAIENGIGRRRRLISGLTRAAAIQRPEPGDSNCAAPGVGSGPSRGQPDQAGRGLDTDLFLILDGAVFDRGRRARRGSQGGRRIVGEMAVVDPHSRGQHTSSRRSDRSSRGWRVRFFGATRLDLFPNCGGESRSDWRAGCATKLPPIGARKSGARRVSQTSALLHRLGARRAYAASPRAFSRDSARSASRRPPV